MGDLIIHPDDDQGFMQKLEETLSPAHQRYYCPKELRGLLESCGFQIKDFRVTRYEKPYRALIEDKASYFDLEPRNFYSLLESAPHLIREIYKLGEGSMMLYYGLLTAVKI